MNRAEINKISQWLKSGSINIFGLPFSGKDTHGEKLQKLFNAVLLSGGDILRSSKGPKHIQEHIGKGHLAPTDEFLAIVLPFLAQPEYKGKPLILSSVGRWHGEEQSVVKAAVESGHPIKAVIYLSITEDEAKRRWRLAKRGREDDVAEDILLNRFNEFRQKTLPVIDYYRQHGLLIEVDGMPSPENVAVDILHKLAALSNS
ncbi:MAG TPA: nucleoside monophosphate kinase [Patescibacteria group bacterium]|nr:nucleoside monophosphate kinase [Patescibacteria group bacterium]